MSLVYSDFPSIHLICRLRHWYTWDLGIWHMATLLQADQGPPDLGKRYQVQWWRQQVGHSRWQNYLVELGRFERLQKEEQQKETKLCCTRPVQVSLFVFDDKNQQVYPHFFVVILRRRSRVETSGDRSPKKTINSPPDSGTTSKRTSGWLSLWYLGPT